MIAAIIQARMGSTRLPGKVMKTLSGKPMLWHIITRLGYAKQLDKIIIATTDREEDKVIASLAEEMGVAFYCGSPEDVLDRYYQTAKTFNVDTIVRITADCPLIDPQIIDYVIDFYNAGDYDYASNAIEATFPDGLDVEVFKFSVLEIAWKEAFLPFHREHVTRFIHQQPNRFKIGCYKGKRDLSHLRWTVDGPEDFTLVKQVYDRLYPENPMFTTDDILELLQENSFLSQINSHIDRNESLKTAIEKDRNFIEELRKRGEQKI